MWIIALILVCLVGVTGGFVLGHIVSMNRSTFKMAEKLRKVTPSMFSGGGVCYGTGGEEGPLELITGPCEWTWGEEEIPCVQCDGHGFHTFEDKYGLNHQYTCHKCEGWGMWINRG